MAICDELHVGDAEGAFVAANHKVQAAATTAISRHTYELTQKASGAKVTAMQHGGSLRSGGQVMDEHSRNETHRQTQRQRGTVAKLHVP